MIVVDIRIRDCVDLIRAEYLEMPGLALTRRQIERMWGLEGKACDEVLDELVTHGFLVRHPDGTFARPREQF